MTYQKMAHPVNIRNSCKETEHKYGVVLLVGQGKGSIMKEKLIVGCISCKLETGHVLKREHVPTHKRGGHK